MPPICSISSRLCRFLRLRADDARAQVRDGSTRLAYRLSLPGSRRSIPLTDVAISDHRLSGLRAAPASTIAGKGRALGASGDRQTLRWIDMPVWPGQSLRQKRGQGRVIRHSGLGSASSHPQSSLNIEVKKLVEGRLTINEI